MSKEPRDEPIHHVHKPTLHLFIEAAYCNAPSIKKTIIHCPLSKEECAQLAEALRKNHTIIELELGPNVVDPEGARYIAEAFKKNYTLRAIHLAYNRIGPKGAEYLAEALGDNHTLQTINLWNTQIGDEGARCISETLKRNTTLEEVKLGFNSIGDEGAARIASALEKNRTLQALDLVKNRIRCEGAKRIAKALAANPNVLQVLELGFNEIGGGETTRHFAEALARNRTLQTLDLRGNKLSSEELLLLNEYLKNGPTTSSGKLVTKPSHQQSVKTPAPSKPIMKSIEALLPFKGSRHTQDARSQESCRKKAILNIGNWGAWISRKGNKSQTS